MHLHAVVIIVICRQTIAVVLVINKILHAESCHPSQMCVGCPCIQVRPQLQASASPPSLAHLRVGSTPVSLSANAAQLMYAATGQSYQYAVGALGQETPGIGLQVSLAS